MRRSMLNEPPKLAITKLKSMMQTAPRQQVASTRRRGPLLGNFEENLLNNRLEQVQTIDGYRVELRASGRFVAPTLKCSNVRMSILSAGDSFPYVGRINIGHFAYRIPKKGNLQVTLFDPLGTLVNLFMLAYDLNDMPANSQTFLRQRTIFAPIDTLNATNQTNVRKCSVSTRLGVSSVSSSRTRCMIQLNIVSSKRGKIYLNRDLRLFVSKKIDLETAAKHSAKEPYAFKSFNEMPENPRYFDR